MGWLVHRFGGFLRDVGLARNSSGIHDSNRTRSTETTEVRKMEQESGQRSRATTQQPTRHNTAPPWAMWLCTCVTLVASQAKTPPRLTVGHLECAHIAIASTPTMSPVARADAKQARSSQPQCGGPTPTILRLSVSKGNQGRSNHDPVCKQYSSQVWGKGAIGALAMAKRTPDCTNPSNAVWASGMGDLRAEASTICAT